LARLGTRQGARAALVHCPLSSPATADAGAAEAESAVGASTQEFLTSAAAYAAICLVVFLFFEYFRRLPATHHFYSPKRCVPQSSGSPTLGLCARARLLDLAFFLSADLRRCVSCRSGLHTCTCRSKRGKRRAQAVQALAQRPAVLDRRGVQDKAGGGDRGCWV